ncbi:hypothetical protein CGRA01v4_06849 [Colletotrichum graminicola]|nr:hypothetical protein CGRA01v4_06849 [Colletotrichum graminicola]
MPLIALTAQTSTTGLQPTNFSAFPVQLHDFWPPSVETIFGHNLRWHKSQCDTSHTGRRSFAGLDSDTTTRPMVSTTNQSIWNSQPPSISSHARMDGTHQQLLPNT